MRNRATNTNWSHGVARSRVKLNFGADQPEGIQTLSISAAAIAEAFATMQREEDVSYHREHERVNSLGMLQMVVEIIQPGATSLRILVHGHDISRGGVSIVNGRFLYPDSVCRCWLKPVNGKAIPHNGKVRWCRHISGIVHVAGISFDSPIQVEDYLAADPHAA